MSVPIARLDRAKRYSAWILGVGLPLIVVLFQFADRHVDRWVASLGESSLVSVAGYYTHLGDRQLWLTLVFAGIVYALLAEWLRGPSRSGRVAFYVCLSFGVALLVGDQLKFLFGRARPELLLTQGIYGFTWFADHGIYHSFPSGHTLRTFAGMTALSLRLPGMAWLFMAAAVLEGVSRVMVLRHFPSDVVCGAMVGMVAALWVDAILARAWEETRTA